MSDRLLVTPVFDGEGEAAEDPHRSGRASPASPTSPRCASGRTRSHGSAGGISPRGSASVSSRCPLCSRTARGGRRHSSCSHEPSKSSTHVAAEKKTGSAGPAIPTKWPHVRLLVKRRHHLLNRSPGPRTGRRPQPQGRCYARMWSVWPSTGVAMNSMRSPAGVTLRNRSGRGAGVVRRERGAAVRATGLEAPLRPPVGCDGAGVGVAANSHGLAGQGDRRVPVADDGVRLGG